MLHITTDTSSLRNCTAERGNVVALTLLVLALAILVGVGGLLFIGSKPSAPTPAPQPAANTSPVTETSSPTNTDNTGNPLTSWTEYRSEEFAVQFRYPPGWIVEAGTIAELPVLTVYDARQTITDANTSATDTQPSTHTLDTRISFYPEGMPEPLPDDVRERSTIILQVPQATERDLVLGGTARPWATYATFNAPPKPWTPQGALFARIHIEEEEVAYMRDGAEIAPDSYDPTAGDELVRYGFTDPTERSVIEQILTTFRFYTTTSNTARVPDTATEDAVRIIAPTPGALVFSPLRVQGEAYGTYRPGGFTVVLEDAAGHELARVPAELEIVSDEIDKPTPFELSLVFATTTATSGIIRLEATKDTAIILTIPISL